MSSPAIGKRVLVRRIDLVTPSPSTSPAGYRWFWIYCSPHRHPTTGSGIPCALLFDARLSRSFRTARGRKVEGLIKALSADYDASKFEVVDVPDIAAGDLSELVKDVQYIIHTAAPSVGKADFDTCIRTAVQGSLHVLEEGYKAGVRKAVMTTSIVSFPPGGSLGVDEFNPITKEEAIAFGPWVAFQDSRSDMDITSLYGPLAPGSEHIVTEPYTRAFSSNQFVYGLINKETEYGQPTDASVDVRDVARAHVLARTSPPSSQVGHKRYLVLSPHSFSWPKAIALIDKERPALKDRLLAVENVSSEDMKLLGLGNEALEDVVGFKKGAWTPWEQTILDSVDSLVRIEDAWKASGYSAQWFYFRERLSIWALASTTPTCCSTPLHLPSFPLNRFKITTSLRVLDLLSTNIRPHDAEVADLLQIVQNSSAVVDSLPDHITNVQDTLSALQATHETRLADAKCILPTIPETEPLLG
ncbi:hypothetical protein CPB85DRAFT_1439091 [Mucidula mucida]|nr:hypothetical protein CPB85DRAFT_1439091 [Mucidula mucida]